MKPLHTYEEFLNEQLKQSNIDLLKRLFSAYQSSRNSKTTLEKLYKLQHKKPYSEIFKEQKIASPPYYRGMSLDKVPEVGDTFKFGLGGWTTDYLVARTFTPWYGQEDIREPDDKSVIFETTNKKHVFIDMNNFGEAIQQYLKKEYPKVDWEERDISKKPPELSKLYTYSKGSHSGENEVIFEPFTAKVKRVTEKKSIPSIYYVEV